MKDIQMGEANVAMPIDCVGIRNLTLPLLVSRRGALPHHTVATVELGVELPAQFKGTHMSRFVEALSDWNEELSYKSMKRLLEDVRQRLQAQKAQILFTFPFFLQRVSPVSGATALQGYECRLTGEISNAEESNGATKAMAEGDASTYAGAGKLNFLLEVCVPVMTVCPCSKAISEQGAHSQRAEVRMSLRLRGFNWLEEFIEIAENSGSSPTYPLLKREDEKYVTEHAFDAPCFVEDVVRKVAEKLEKHPQVAWFRVEVESFESIHAHNAYARIERKMSEGQREKSS